MRTIDWLQLAAFIALLALITKPMGLYLIRVLDANGKTWLDPIIKPLERLTYRLMGVKPEQEQDWKRYTFAMLLFSLVGCLFTYGILRLQHLLPLNPQGFGPVSPDLAFNTAMSFTTNTNWQSHGGESTMSYLSQMVALVIHNFTSAATGIALAAALVRGIARHSAETIGSFWVDLVRITYYLLLPICLVLAVFLVSQGMIQNCKPYTKAKLTESYTIQVAKTDAKGQTVTTNVPVMVQVPKLDSAGKPVMLNGVAMMVDAPKLDDKGQPVLTNTPVMVDQKVDEQTIAQGPVASQVAIKMLGTNGGGFFNANAAHPFENPTALSNFVQMLSIFLIGAALTNVFGRMVGNQRQGWAILGIMGVLFIAGVTVAYWAEANGTTAFDALGLTGGNMEGKEVRFGIVASSLFAVITTAASCGGVGAGLYGMLLFVVLAIFVAGLMVGRTPEYVGKKIEAREVKMAMLAILVLPLMYLGWTAIAVVYPTAVASMANAGPHGFTEVLYAYVSQTGNNGSAFGGLTGNILFYNVTGGVAMFVGRFFMIIPAMAMAGSLAGKKSIPASAGTLPTTGGLFVGLVVGVILIIGGLTFFPALALGPIAEHLAMTTNTLF